MINSSSILPKLNRLLAMTPDQAVAVPQLDRKTLVAAVTEMKQLQDRLAEITDAGRQGWAQLVRLNEWLQAHAPDDYAADNDTATAVLAVLDRHQHIIGELVAERDALHAVLERTNHHGTTTESA